MSTFRDRFEALGWAATLLAFYAIIIGAISVAINVGDAVGGEIPPLIRVLLGILGVVVGLLLLAGRDLGVSGGTAIMAWAVLQIPVFAWNTDGNPFTQVLEFPLSFTSQTTVNGEVTSYSEIGINLVGVLLTIWASKVRGRVAHVEASTGRSAADTSLYDIQHRLPDGTTHLLGSTDNLDAARRASEGQATRLRGGGERGEVVVVQRPGGRLLDTTSLS